MFACLLTGGLKAQFNNEWIDHSKTYYKFFLAQDGMYRISGATLAAAGLGNTPAEHFQLWRHGEEVALYTSAATGPLAANGFIEFAGKKNDGRKDRGIYLQPQFQLTEKVSLFTDTAAYFLTVNNAGPNKRYNTLTNDLTAPLPPALPYFLHTARHDYRRADGRVYVNKGFAVNYGEYVYSSSFDNGEMLSSEEIQGTTANRQAVFNNLLPATGTGVNARLRVSWAGSSPGSRDASASIEGTTVVNRRIQGFNAFRDSNINVNMSLLSNPSVTLQINNLSTNGFDRIVAGFAEIEYPRQTDAANASYFETAIPASAGKSLLTLARFRHDGTPPVLYNLTAGYRMAGVIDANGNVQFSLPAASTRQDIIITANTPGSFAGVTPLQTRNFVNYATTAAQGDYLIITNRRLLGGTNNPVEAYRTYRSTAAGGGFSAKIYDIEELCDQFAFGIKMHPLSIKNFLRFARATFATAPKNCFLIGKGVTYDELRINESNTLAAQLQLVPTYGFPGSDNLLASADLTALPATPIGRLSVVNVAEVNTYLEKVKQYEAAQANPSISQADKAWMKNVVHVVGANDAGTEVQIRPYMNEYTRIVQDTLFGASVTTFNKFNSTTASTIENIVLSRLFESGISLLTYFGHSSATALDYNLDNPNEYNNPGKYPVFLLNGCNAGNFFNFETPRLQTQATISERYVLAPNRGAIGLVASTHFGLVGGLGVYSRGFYRSVSQQAYGQTLGQHIRNSVQFMFNTWGTDYQARFHTEQQTLHGDPAIRLNGFARPDYSIEQQNVLLDPAFISVAETRFKTKIFYYNLGRAINDSIVVEIKRQYPVSSIYPSGFTETVYRQKRKAPLFIDSIELELPIVSERDKGINNLIIALDAENKIAEISETNNTLTNQVVIFENELRPIAPANFAIINTATVKLVASTANPLSEPLNYAFEMDTTALFNSAAKISRSITASGGLVEIDPGITLANQRTYYWRLGLLPAGGGAPLRWNNASFTYIVGSETGFSQGHFYQHTQSTANRMRMDSGSRKWQFNVSTNNLFVTHSIFPTSGTEDNHFAISVNNNLVSSAACVGHSLIFNVFDSLTFKPMRNTGTWGSGLCANGRNPFNFEWDDRVFNNRKRMLEFMDAIPDGSFVVVRKILDEPYQDETFAERLKADEQQLGAGNSIYHRLKNAGFTDIDSFNRPRTFIFVYQKNKQSFQPIVKYSDGLFDRIQINVNIPTVDTMGVVQSPVFGPAASWKNAQWSGSHGNNATGDRVQFRIIGVRQNGTSAVLATSANTADNVNLAGVNAREFPFVRFEMLNVDSVKGTPWDLNWWRLYYNPVPEGALAANLVNQFKDSAQQGEQLNLRIAFKNISNLPFDSLKATLAITGRNNVTTTFTQRRRPLPAGDTLILNFPLQSKDFAGINTIYLAVNPDNDQPEQYFFNNFLYTSLFVEEDLKDPLLDVTFDGVHILNRDIVSAKPHIQIRLKDDNRFMLLNDTADLTVRLQFPNENRPRIYRWNTDTLRFNPPAPGGDNTAVIDFFPVLNEDTEGFDYELSVTGKDRNNNRAGDKDYRVTFQVFNKPMISNLLNYPNPFSTSTAFVFTITGTEIPQEFKIQILTVTGKIVKEITKGELGPLRIGNNITEYKWDGTDMFGQKLANGVYLYRVISSLDGKKMEQFRLNENYDQNAGDVTDRFFKKGYGKMVILR